VTGAEGAEAAPRPLRFRAATVHAYVLPELRSLTLIGDACRVFDRVRPPLLEVHTALYSKIDDPPLLAGGENTTVTLWCPAVADVIVGAPGTVITGGESVTTGAELADGGPKPTRLRAITLQVYVFEPVSPLTRVGDACSVLERLTPPSLDTQVTLYWKIDDPPLLAGGE
jgi:hypothetical protein